MMRKKVLVLMVCLVVCALFLQSIPYGVKASANPTAAGLAEFAIKAYQEGWGYIYGTYGQVMTQTIIDGKARQYPGNFNSILSDGRTIYQTAQKWIGHRAADCVGLMKAYLWWQGDALGPAYNSAHDRSANGTFEAATVKGPIGTIPDTHGICVWRDGHVGVYIGNGWVIEARGTSYGVVMTRLSDRGWTHWFRNPFVSYSASGWTTIAGQTYYYAGGVYLTGIQEIDGRTYNFGGDGVLTSGMALDGGKLRYFRRDGSLLTGWQILDQERYYFDAEGFASTGWTEIDGQRHLFSKDGILLTGWQAVDDKIYYLDEAGIAKTGGQDIEGRRFWFGPDGELLTGWQSDPGGPRYRDQAGLPVTGLQLIDGKAWLFDERGELLTGWQSAGGKQYYFDPVTGAGLSAGLQVIDKEARLFDSDGSLHRQAGLFLSGNQLYWSDGDGYPQTGDRIVTGIDSQGESMELTLHFAADGSLLPYSDPEFVLDSANQTLMLSDDPALAQSRLSLQYPLPETGLPLTWLSLDPSVAAVRDNGTVQAIGKGRTLIVARSAAGQTAACIVTVLPDLTGCLSEDLDLSPGQSVRLPDSGLQPAPDNRAVFISSEPAVAEVDETGLVTALQPGKSEIIVTYQGRSARICSLTVREPLLGLTVNRSAISLPVGATAEPFAECIRSGCLETITFVSSQPSVATVSADGTIRGLSHGTAVITAQAGGYSARCSVTVSGAYPVLRRGSSGEQVRDLQQRLTDLGYIAGPIDGSFGPLTEFGVLCAQKRLGLNLTGTADHALRIALQADTAPRATALQDENLLQPGDNNESVYVLQQRLADLGFFKGIVSGRYDSLTVQAVQTMRVINSLPSAEYADLALISRLLGHKITAGRATLEPGFAGYEVSLLQARLQQLQYYGGPIDGNFNDDVTRAVKAFQYQHGLSVDGYAGPATQRALYADNALRCTPEAIKAVTLTTLKTGMSGAAVKILEDKLVQLGYHLGLADNIYDGLTANSISAFQKRSGLTQTGTADINTQLRLFDEMAKTSPAIYQYGSRGTSVQRIQTRLNQLGFNCGIVDGSYGGKTQTAVRNFQNQAGLPADGQAAWTTLARLFAADAPNAPSGAPSASSAGASMIEIEIRLTALGYLYAVPDGLSNSMTVNAVKAFQKRCGLSQTGSINSSTRNRLFSATAPVSTAQYKYGSRGTTVKCIQTRLNQLGFSCGTVDGSFGAKTRSAVKSFQTKAGLKVTGIVDYAAAAALFAATAPQAG